MITVLLSTLAALTAQQAAIRALANQDLRVATIGDRLARGSAALCPGQVAAPGWVLQDAAQYSGADRDAARAVLGLRDGTTVVSVVQGSAADRAGARAGDRITTVNGELVSASIEPDRYARIAQVEGMTEGKPKVSVTVERDGVPTTFELPAHPGCASRFQIVTGRALNAKADGRYVQIGGPMVDFATNDDELAVVLAHELAHNVLRHRALGTPSRKAEIEADRVGVWLLARAGYDIDAVVPFWTRLGKRTGLGILSDGSHPRWKDRIALVARAVADVKAQTAAGQPLVPPSQGAIPR